jgi:hypothetical protein
MSEASRSNPGSESIAAAKLLHLKSSFAERGWNFSDFIQENVSQLQQ